MPFKETNFVRTLLTGTVTTLYTVQSGNTIGIKSILLANSDKTKNNVLVYFVPSGGEAGLANVAVPDVPIRGNTMFDWEGYQVMDAGGTIQGSASGNVTIHVSGAVL